MNDLMNLCMSYNFAARLTCEMPQGHDGSHIAFDKRNMVVGWPNDKAITSRWVAPK